MKTSSLFILFISLLSSSAFAQEAHFFNLHIPYPPKQGSVAYQDDFRKLHEYQSKRTEVDCSKAGEQSTFSLDNAFGPSTGVLTAEEVEEAKLLSLKVYAKVAPSLIYFKQKFKRLRPWLEDSTLTPCIRKPKTNDYAYPSGHSANGFAMAIALARKFPAKADLIMKQGYQIGENRLIGGVHHPSDVEAGRILATEIMDDEDDL